MKDDARAEMLQTLEDCGAAEMPLDEALLIAEISEGQFAGDEEAKTRFRTGQLKTKLAVRQSVVKMAKEGVPQMVKIYLEFNAQPKADVMDDGELTARLPPAADDPAAGLMSAAAAEEEFGAI